MTGSASPDGMWSIGELAEQAGVTVKTVRFYSDRGLLPEAGRSAGGHRRYGPGALDRLRLIRSLRTLDLPLPEVRRILAQEDAPGAADALEDAVAGQLRDLGTQLAALRWREAALHLLRDCTPEERADRLRLIGAVSIPPSTDVLARFWRHVLPPRLPARLLSTLLEAAVPQPPADPTPSQVLVFARLHAVATDRRVVDIDVRRLAPRTPDESCRPAVLYEGLVEACALASADVRDRRPPYAGEALDCFVAAHAGLRGTRDTPAFRRQLSAQLGRIAHPLLDRYWQLVGELPSASRQPTIGAMDDWLRAALDAQVA
ncbi:MerR family transcriptional regulator [Streptomyces angustmyceticus]|uniref:MerR family transcriptional regulator n=1 Tax=Streptomyces angustmyceticus TaxID=285578 RepID=A0A5J4LRG2_9ACTN|nr:MerR family transcriptional regulator [Streptomyces angustmyceticus]GES33015.1 MerR family transcriptional regulator [Streptomyces angustmyceticus]